MSLSKDLSEKMKDLRGIEECMYELKEWNLVSFLVRQSVRGVAWLTNKTISAGRGAARWSQSSTAVTKVLLREDRNSDF